MADSTPLPAAHTLIPVRENENLTAVLSQIGSDLPSFTCSLDDFELGPELGHGTFGAVYHATRKSSGSVVALKKLFVDHLEGSRLRRYNLEIESMVHVRSPYAVCITGFSVSPVYCIVTEFLSNGPLSKWVRPNDLLNPTQKAIVALGLARGLAHIHAQGILHRDLKSSNILLDESFYPRIGDLGLARFDPEDEHKSMKVGTIHYMAPEILGGRSDYGPPVDIYALGFVLYELVEHKQALSGIQSLKDACENVCVSRKRPKFSRGVPDACKSLILRCT
jgi:serine/threonine protein kinase